MSFSDIIKKKHFLLIPFSWLYKFGVYIYHKLYDLGLLKSYKPSIPTICVGNLSVGGTGKSPMVEYIVSLLTSKYCVGVISRGYRRKTKGYVLANADTTANDIGDEPMQFHQKFPDVCIAVGEKRAEAIAKLLQQKKETDIIVLDDAFQHRAVTADLNILLTEYTNPFPNDWYLPAGSLRDLKSNYKRAHIIVITKCDPNLSKPGKDKMIQSIKPFSYQKIFLLLSITVSPIIFLLVFARVWKI
nr:tetraacyldisaccharide 4'-kinase [Niabella ginsengisoli]